jgi:hypothetical protein
MINLSRPRRLIAASTLIEAMIACGVVSIFFCGIYDMNWRGMFLVKAGLDAASASCVLTNLAENIRTATWQEITTPSYLSSTILAGSTRTGHLPNVVQTITVNPYPIPNGYGTPPVGAATVEVVSNSGTFTTLYSGNGTLASQTAIRIDITLSWNSTLHSAPHTRMVSLITSPGGILGQN